MPPPAELPSGWSGILTFCDGPRNCVGWRLGTLPFNFASLLHQNFSSFTCRMMWMAFFFFLSHSCSLVSITSVLLMISRHAFFNSCARIQGASGDTHSVARVPRYKGCGTPTDIADSPTRGGWHSWHSATPRYTGEYVKYAARVFRAMLLPTTTSPLVWVLRASTYATRFYSGFYSMELMSLSLVRWRPSTHLRPRLPLHCIRIWPPPSVVSLSPRKSHSFRSFILPS
jgi:hypothetical protein